MKGVNALVARLSLAIGGLGSLGAVVWLAIIATTPVTGAMGSAIGCLLVIGACCLFALFALGMGD